MIELLELKFSRRWQTNKIESDWSNSPRHSSSRQFLSPRSDCELSSVGKMSCQTLRKLVLLTLSVCCRPDEYLLNIKVELFQAFLLPFE